MVSETKAIFVAQDDDRQKADQEEKMRGQFLDQFTKMERAGVNYGVAFDFDETLSVKKNNGLDPSETEIHPSARAALQSMHENGVDIVLLSARGGADLERIVQIPGITYIGSNGAEVRKDGVSYIHPKFEPHQRGITNLLHYIRMRVNEELNLKTKQTDQPYIFIPNEQDKRIILQRKGYTENYREGIAFTFNLNNLSPQERQTYLEQLLHYYQQAMHLFILPENRGKVSELVFPRAVGHIENSWFSVSFQMKSLNAKARAIAQLMLPPEDTLRRPQHFAGIPSHTTWIFSGDNPVEDGAVMRAGRHIAIHSGKKQNEFGVYGIWTRHESQKNVSVPSADLVVDGVEGHCDLLEQMAHIVQTSV